jgi:AGZA family xanthine/uracil permease-like MFS transporter
MFCILRAADGKWRSVPIAMYGVSAVFAFYFMMPALGLL